MSRDGLFARARAFGLRVVAACRCRQKQRRQGNSQQQQQQQQQQQLKTTATVLEYDTSSHSEGAVEPRPTPKSNPEEHQPLTHPRQEPEVGVGASEPTHTHALQRRHATAFIWPLKNRELCTRKAARCELQCQLGLGEAPLDATTRAVLTVRCFDTDALLDTQAFKFAASHLEQIMACALARRSRRSFLQQHAPRLAAIYDLFTTMCVSLGFENPWGITYKGRTTTCRVERWSECAQSVLNACREISALRGAPVSPTEYRKPNARVAKARFAIELAAVFGGIVEPCGTTCRSRSYKLVYDTRLEELTRIARFQ